MGPGVAIECESQDGLHVWEDHFIPEIIDPVTLKVLPYGEQGELVITTITKEGIPILRYRTRDITTIKTGTLCLWPNPFTNQSAPGPNRRYADYPWCERLPDPD